MDRHEEESQKREQYRKGKLELSLRIKDFIKGEGFSLIKKEEKTV